MSIVSKRIQRTQPLRYSDSIDWSNPLTNGLVAFFDTSQGYDRVTQKTATVNSSTFNDSGRSGKAASFASTTNMQFANDDRYNVTGAFTVLSLCDIRTLTNYTPIISKIGTTTTNMPFEFRIASSPTATTARLYLLRANASGYRGFQASTVDLFTAPRLETIVGASSSDGNVQTLPKLYLDSNIYTATTSLEGSGTGPVTSNSNNVWIGRRSDGATQLDGRIYFVALWNRQLTDAEYLSFERNPWQIFKSQIFVLSKLSPPVHKISPKWVDETEDKVYGTLPTFNNDSIKYDRSSWEGFRNLAMKSVQAGKTFEKDIASTYSLVLTFPAGMHVGGVLDTRGDIHFVPYNAQRGQKVSVDGTVSTYSLIMTSGGSFSNYFAGGILRPNGDVDFVPSAAPRGQRISSSGVVSTYALVYTTSLVGAYWGGVLGPNGEAHFAPAYSPVGQKIQTSGFPTTYTIPAVGFPIYYGGVLAPNGDVHFFGYQKNIKISIYGEVTTYPLVYTGSISYGGVLDLNGNIHMVPYDAPVGQKVSIDGIVSTYSLAYTTSSAYLGGVLAPNGDVHFIPYYASVGQKVSMDGTVSTYSLAYTLLAGYIGGVLNSKGEIHFVPYNATVGQKISTSPAIPFDPAVCESPFLNKF